VSQVVYTISFWPRCGGSAEYNRLLLCALPEAFMDRPFASGAHSKGNDY